jgi:hypothetical protein
MYTVANEQGDYQRCVAIQQATISSIPNSAETTLEARKSCLLRHLFGYGAMRQDSSPALFRVSILITY